MAVPAFAGTVYAFNGGAVGGCTLSGQTYTCARLPLSNQDDGMSIGSGYIVNVQSNVALSYNQTLSMSGSAQLLVSGNLDIGNIAPANLKVSGGTLKASGSFSFGAQAQTMTADVSAASVVLGTGSTITITGTISSSGPVTIGSHATVNGPISGTVISTDSPVTLRGNINATTSFTLESGSSLNGNITAPVVVLRPSRSVVTGDIVATTSVQIGSDDTVTGNVRSNKLTMDDSNAIIQGSVTVASATLGYHDRVTQTVYCSGGTASGQCDCVVNNSQYAVNTAQGPTCAPATPPPPAAIDHFLITHDGSATACVPKTVTVTACGNASCTPPHYAGGATFSIAPNDVATTYTIGSSGINSAVTVTALSGNPVAISLSNATSASSGPQCRNTSTSSNSCTLSITDTAGFVVTVPNHAAGTTQNLSLQAIQLNSKNQCVPAFSNVTKTITLAPSYVNPSASQSVVTIAGTNVAPGRTTNVALAFNASGVASTSLVSADVGLIQIGASYTGMNNVGSFIAAPHHFAVSNLPGTTGALPRAGDKFSFTVSAYNSANQLTPNFGLESPAAETVNVGFTKCSGANAGQTTLSGVSAFAGGSATATAIWSEVGTLAPKVSVANINGYLRSNLFPTGGGDCNSPSNVTGLFQPAYFEVAQAAPQKPGEQAQLFYYSGQPMALTQGSAGVVITARNRSGGTTTNYSQGVALSALAADGTALAPAAGTLAVPPYPAFSNGQLALAPTFTFSSVPAAPLKVRLRASNGAAAPNEVSSRDANDASKEFTPEIRFGRLRLFAYAGYANTDLNMPVRVEYWSGRSWLTNTLDSYTVVPAGAVGLSPVAGFGGASAAAPIQFASGSATLLLRPASGARIGALDVALNLGAGASDNSCLASHPATAAANLPYLRSLNGQCASAYDRDPSARATFGVFAPDLKRIIHVREVFN